MAAAVVAESVNVSITTIEIEMIACLSLKTTNKLARE